MPPSTATGPRSSSFSGCSTGGRQALVEAERFPADFDGIIAGAAANPKANLDAWRLAMAQAMLSDPASFIPPAKHPMIHTAVLNACDHLDGVKDGLIENPMRCTFDPRSLACGGAEGADCLTTKQVAAATVIMNPVKHPKTGELVFPRLEPGTELGWSRLLGGPTAYDAAIEQFKFIVFSDPDWDWRTFDLARDLAAAATAGGGRAGRRQPRPDGVRTTRRQAADVSRLGRPEYRSAGQREFLQQGDGGNQAVGEIT